MKGFGRAASILFAAQQALSVPALADVPRPGGPAVACDIAKLKASADTTITSMTVVDQPARHCRIVGYVTTTNPGPNQVNFIAALPDRWNGRYLFVVPGGSGGQIQEPPASYIARGYALATTDRGTHVKHTLDFSFFRDPARATDFAHRGPHVTTLATQALARSYYGREQHYRYITGCSTGGVAAMMEAEWYPQDAEAFIAGAVDADGGPPDFWGYVAQSLFRDPAKWISEAEMQRIAGAIMQRYDGADGAIDGLIWDPTRIVLDRALFPFLSDQQFWTLKVLGEGFANAEGKAQGYWLSNPVPLAPAVLGTTPPPWTEVTQPRLFRVTDSAAKARYGEAYNVLAQADYTRKPVETDRPLAPGMLNPRNLARVQQEGGKVLMYIGAADQNSSPQNHVDYAGQVVALYGEARSQWFRSFIVPGMYHCGGGVGQPQHFEDSLLQAAEGWVERGEAPDFVIGANPERKRSYRVCAWPHAAVFKGGLANPGKLDVNDAANWSCSGRVGEAAAPQLNR